jgi:hypothetical protein
MIHGTNNFETTQAYLYLAVINYLSVAGKKYDTETLL